MTNVTSKVVGLTGGLGSGKSTVRRLFEQLDVPSVDADVVARQIHQDPNHPAMADIARAFPTAIAQDGRLSRGSLREIFAANPAANTRLKAILGPHVISHILQWTAQQSAPYVMWESALVIEEEIAVDRIVVVDASQELQIARVRARNPDWSITQINNVLSMQLARVNRLSFAHDTISNGSSLGELALQVQALHRAYLQRWTQ